MINTIDGRYLYCKKCRCGVDKLVDRRLNIASQTTEELKENKLVVGDPYVGIPGATGSYQIHSVAPKQYGWECPKCGAVMSPDQKTCPFCAPPATII